MKRICKRSIVIIPMIILSLGSSKVAYGEVTFGYEAWTSQQRITLDTFDYQRYAREYPDVALNVGEGKANLYEHYRNIGEKEGRLAYTLPYTASKLDTFRFREDEAYYFDPEDYSYAYYGYIKDEDNKFDKQSLWENYKRIGYEEKRKINLTDTVRARQKVFDVADRIVDESMSERDKVRAVHDWIVMNTKYPDGKINIKEKKSDYSKREYTIEGVMLDGVGVCKGYAETFDYFMFVLGIEHEFVLGYGGYGRDELHAWNRVLIDGEWLYVDCTWDDRGENYLSHRYLLIPKKVMDKDHVEEKTFKVN